MNISTIGPIDVDTTDLRLLAVLQDDASLSNQALAERAHVSPATSLRRVQRLTEAGVIERRVALLSADRLGASLTAIVEITLDRQTAEASTAFEALAAAEPAIQQCYRVSSGPDFILVLCVRDMDAYHALVHRCFTAKENVRNVRSFFSIRRTKFAPQIPLPNI